MESITIKVDPAFARAMEKAMKPLYSTKTEFIRAALREKLEREKQKAKALQAIDKYYGSAKTHTSDEEIHRIREKVARELLREHGLDPDDHTLQMNSSGARHKATSRSS